MSLRNSSSEQSASRSPSHGFFCSLPKTDEAKLIGRQLIRSATSVAANYRAAGRARSRAEFIAKIGTVVEEIDETVFGSNCSQKPPSFRQPRFPRLT